MVSRAVDRIARHEGCAAATGRGEGRRHSDRRRACGKSSNQDGFEVKFVGGSDRSGGLALIGGQRSKASSFTTRLSPCLYQSANGADESIDGKSTNGQSTNGRSAKAKAPTARNMTARGKCQAKRSTSPLDRVAPKSR